MRVFYKQNMWVKKGFLLEGGEALIPGISVALREAAENYGVQECVLGMAHRGRLNTLANISLKNLFAICLANLKVKTLKMKILMEM